MLPAVLNDAVSHMLVALIACFPQFIGIQFQFSPASSNFRDGRAFTGLRYVCLLVAVIVLTLILKQKVSVAFGRGDDLYRDDPRQRDGLSFSPVRMIV